jgi:hypothetical protein
MMSATDPMEIYAAMNSIGGQLHVLYLSMRHSDPSISQEEIGNLLTQDELTQVAEVLGAISSVDGGSESKDKKAPTESGKPAKKLQVDKFVITGAKLRVGATLLGGTAAIPLPDIHFTNLGTGPEGITPGELTKRVLEAIEEGAVKAAAASVGELGKGALDTATGAGKTATDAAGNAAKGITDLFKKKK